MDDEARLLPISALQHLLFCPRQCALIYLERLWAENRFTAEGGRLHRRVHERPRVEVHADRCIARGVRLWSRRLGLVGVADVVEFRPVDQPPRGPPASAVADPGAGGPASPLGSAGDLVPRGGVGSVLPPGRWRPFPVEYKRGRPKRNLCDRVQLCAQALCLEEMFGEAIPAGALFYGRTRRRLDVAFDADLRRATLSAVADLRRLFASGATPSAEPGPACRSCSMQQVCLPGAVTRSSARAWLDRTLAALSGPAPPLSDEDPL